MSFKVDNNQLRVMDFLQPKHEWNITCKLTGTKQQQQMQCINI